MKKLTLLALLAVVLVSCNKKEIIEFEMPYTTDIVLPVTTFTGGTTSTFTTQNIWTKAGETFDAKGTNSDIVGTITFKDMSLSIKTPTTTSLNWINNIRFYMQAEGQPELEVASRYNTGADTIKPGTKTITLNFTDANVKNRLVENAIKYKIKILPYSVPPATTITLTHNFNVKAIK